MVNTIEQADIPTDGSPMPFAERFDDFVKSNLKRIKAPLESEGDGLGLDVYDFSPDPDALEDEGDPVEVHGLGLGVQLGSPR